MALWLKLMLNDQRIGHLVARRRLGPRAQPRPEDVCLYDWSVDTSGVTRTNAENDPLRHRYGDGGWALVGRILDAAGHSYTPLSGKTRTRPVNIDTGGEGEVL